MPRWIWLISSYTRKHTVKLSLFMQFTAQVRLVNQSDYSTNILILNIYIYVCQWRISQNGNMQSRVSKLHLTFILSLLSPPVQSNLTVCSLMQEKAKCRVSSPDSNHYTSNYCNRWSTKTTLQALLSIVACIAQTQIKTSYSIEDKLLSHQPL